MVLKSKSVFKNKIQKLKPKSPQHQKKQLKSIQMKNFFYTLALTTLFTLGANAQEATTAEAPKMSCCAKAKSDASKVQGKTCHAGEKAEATDQSATNTGVETKKCAADKKECSKTQKTCSAEEQKSCDKAKKSGCCAAKKEEDKS